MVQSMGSSFLLSLVVPKYLKMLRKAQPPRAIAKNQEGAQTLVLANDNEARLYQIRMVIILQDVEEALGEGTF